MIVKNNRDIFDVYRGGNLLKAVYKGTHLVWTPYLRVNKDVCWVSVQNIDTVLIESNRQHWFVD